MISVCKSQNGTVCNIRGATDCYLLDDGITTDCGPCHLNYTGNACNTCSHGYYEFDDTKAISIQDDGEGVRCFGKYVNSHQRVVLLHISPIPEIHYK